MTTTVKIIGIRVTPEFHDLVARVSKARGEHISSFARRAILKELAALSFLPDDVKKALGLDEKEGLSND